MLLVAAALLTASVSACQGPPKFEPNPCYEQYRVIPVEEVTSLGLAPIDAIDRYSAVFADASGEQRTVDVRLRRPQTAWVREIIRQPKFGFTETLACDTRIGVEVEVEVETGEQWFAEAFAGAAVRSEFHDGWMVQALRPLDRIEGTYAEEWAPDGCSDVDIGFSLTLDASTSGGTIAERRRTVSPNEDDCYREIMAWDLGG